MHGTISDAWAKRVVHRVSHGLQRCCFETWLLTKLKIINHGDRVMYTERIIKQLFSAVCIYRKYQDSLYYEHIIYIRICINHEYIYIYIHDI